MILNAFGKIDSFVTDGLVKKYENPSARRFAAFITHAGDAVIHAPVFLVVYAFGGGHVRRFVICTFAATLIGVAALYALRLTVKRRRPIGEMPKEFAILPKMEQYSFPSGHAMRNSIFPVTLFAFFGAAPAAAAAVAAFFAVSARVYLRLHFFSDIVVGSLLGLISAALSLKIF